MRIANCYSYVIFNMDKYIGNKKAIVDGIDAFLKKKKINNGMFIDIFAGTTNVSQYFKQKGYGVVCNDINDFSYAFGKVYIENNTFPKFEKLLSSKEFEDYIFDEEKLEWNLDYIKKKIKGDKLFDVSYYDKVDFENGIQPLIKVIQYLNSIDIMNLNEVESLFYDYYCIEGDKAGFVSSRGTTGKRNYFLPENAKRLGKILSIIKNWKSRNLISEMECYVLLVCVIEEVTLNANVNGTFHDFNRKKLYPNAEAKLALKPIMLNIVDDPAEYYVFRCDANEIKNNERFCKIDISNSILYIDPPYNFRQYSAYYHMINFIAKYCEIDDVLTYAQGFEYVRGQNMSDNFISQYCYKDSFIPALQSLVSGIKAKHVVISYYDENNHWNHGKDKVSMEGRKCIVGMFKSIGEFEKYDKQPSIIERQNYQSQSGGRKKVVEELLFYARR